MDNIMMIGGSAIDSILQRVLLVFVVVAILFLCTMSAFLKRHPSIFYPTSLQPEKIPYFMMIYICIFVLIFGLILHVVWNSVLGESTNPYKYQIIGGMFALNLCLVLQIYYNLYRADWITFQYMWDNYIFGAWKATWFRIGQFFTESYNNLWFVTSEVGTTKSV